MAKHPNEMTHRERLEQIALRKFAHLPHDEARQWLKEQLNYLIAEDSDRNWKEIVNTLREIADYIESGKLPLEHYPTGRIED